MPHIQVEFRLQAAFRYDETAKAHIGVCPTLCIASQGETREEAARALLGAITMFIQNCAKRHVLDKVFSTLNLTPEKHMDADVSGAEIRVSQPPVGYTDTSVFNVPLCLVARDFNQRSRGVAHWQS